MRRGLVLALAAAACGGAAPPGAEPAKLPAAPTGLADERWASFHSARHATTLPLPDGRAWRIDDHSRPELVATHPSGTRVTLRLVQDAGELVNRAKCEAKAREAKFVADAPLSVVEETEGIEPSGWDARVVVAVEKRPGELVGHVMSFSSLVRKCVWFHFETRVKAGAEEELSDRLAVGRAKIQGRLKLDAFGEVPRQRLP